MSYTKEKRVIRKHFPNAVFGNRVNSYGEVYFRFSIESIPCKLSNELRRLGHHIDDVTGIKCSGTVNMQTTDMPVFELF